VSIYGKGVKALSDSVEISHSKRGVKQMITHYLGVTDRVRKERMALAEEGRSGDIHFKFGDRVPRL
jgi:hypothetical protein